MSPPRSTTGELRRDTRACGDALAAVDGLSPAARRLAELERRSHGAHRVRAHRDAADRLTNDPNTVFFFLDHLHDRPPFRLEDDTTWDTNLEQGIAWGLRLIEKDQELHGAVAQRKAVRDAVGRRVVERRSGARDRTRRARARAAARDRRRHARRRRPAGDHDRRCRRSRRRGSRASIARRCSASPRPAAVSTSSSIAIRIATSPTRSSTRAAGRRRRRPKRARSRSCIGDFLRGSRLRARQRVPARAASCGFSWRCRHRRDLELDRDLVDAFPDQRR